VSNLGTVGNFAIGLLNGHINYPTFIFSSEAEKQKECKKETSISIVQNSLNRLHQGTNNHILIQSICR
jgi:hypothetical protein